MIPAVRRHAFLLVAIGLHLALATAYAVSTPAFEAPDENGHCYYASFIAQRFPSQPIVLGSHELAGRTIWDESDLGHHPPGYYLVLAGVLRLLCADDLVPTPRALGSSTGAFQYAHGFDETSSGSFEIHVLLALRLVSVLCGALSVWLTYGIARTLWPERRALAGLAAVLLAVIPQWSYAHGCLDNGNLATTLSHLVVWLLARTLAAPRPTVGLGVSTGLACGAALMTKATSLALAPTIAAVLVWIAWRDPARRRAALRALAIAGTTATLCYAPQVIRNLVLYGEPLARAVHADAFAQSRLPSGETLHWLIRGFLPSLASSFVGMFGWWRLALSPSAYIAAGAIVAGGLAGLVLVRRRNSDVAGRFVLLGSSILFSFLVVLQFNLDFAQPQGRYLFPAAGPIVLLVGIGWTTLAEFCRAGRVIPIVLGAAGAISAAVVHLDVFRPSFTVEPPETSSAYAAILSGGLRSATPPDAIEITLLEPVDESWLDAAPTFRFTPAGAGAPCTIHLWLDSGRVLGATFEQIRSDLSTGTFALPADIWDQVPHGGALHWNVRRVADRRRGEDPRTMPGSATWVVRRH